MLSRVLLLGLLALAGCAEPAPAPDKAPKRPAPASDEAGLRAEASEDTLDPWPHLRLAELYEGRGQYDRAIRAYGECINRLPPRSATRPVLKLGILHHRLGNLEVARRCYGEVLDTFPSVPSRFQTNPDFRAAARGARAALLDLKQPGGLPALERRFLGELGGKADEWQRRPEWLTPLPSESDPGRGGAEPPAGAKAKD